MTALVFLLERSSAEHARVEDKIPALSCRRFYYSSEDPLLRSRGWRIESRLSSLVETTGLANGRERNDRKLGAMRITGCQVLSSRSVLVTITRRNFSSFLVRLCGPPPYPEIDRALTKTASVRVTRSAFDTQHPPSFSFCILVVSLLGMPYDKSINEMMRHFLLMSTFCTLHDSRHGLN